MTTVQGSAAKPYEIRETEDPNVLWCSCPAWRNNKERPKTCKHIKSLDGNHNAPAPTPEVVKARKVAAGKPMRMESVDPKDALALFESPEWVVEQKVDGTRVVVTVDGPKVSFTASNGQPLKHSTSLLHTPAIRAALPKGEYTLDGELLWTGDFWVFDIIRHDGKSTEGDAASWRRALLETWFELTDVAAPVRLLPQAKTVADKAAILRQVHDAGGEGVILKRTDKPYEYGRRVVHQLKLKFTKTVDCVVTARNTNGHTNAELHVYDDAGAEVAIGSCSMLGKPDAQVGDVVEVKYLYASEDMRLYQPTLLKIRTDKDAADCLIGQLTPVNKMVLETL